MWTKLWSSLAFLVVFAFTLFLATKQQNRITSNQRSSGTGIISYGYAVLSLLLGFVQFWLLTRVFPALSAVVLLTLAASTGLILHNAIGKIAGFGDQPQKIKVLTTVWSARWGTKHRFQACAMMVGILVVVFLAPFVALYHFARLPIGSAREVIWVTLLLFILPQLFATLFGLGVIGPMMVSQFVDDDVRNALLTTQFSGAIYSTVALVFPVSILSRNGQFLSWLPQGEVYWLAVTAPLLLFFVGGVFPYLAGVFRHRAKRRSLVKWRKEWLRSVRKIALSPSGSNRAKLFEEKIAALDKTIEERIAENEILQLYEQIRIQNPPTPAPAFVPAALPEPSISSPPASSETSEAPPAEAAAPLELVTNAPAPVPTAETASAPGADPIANVRRIIEEHADQFPEWDTQFRDLDKLMELQRSLSGSDPVNAKDFVEVELKDTDEELESLHSKRNAIVSSLLTLLPAIGSWLFKTYQNDIMSLIRRLAS